MARWPFNSHQWRHARQVTLTRAQGICEVRGPTCTHIATEADHWPTPLAEILDHNGPQHTAELLRLCTDPQNLRAACKRCNAGLGARLGAARRWGTRRRTPRHRPTIRRVSREW